MIAVTVAGVNHAAKPAGPESWGKASDLSDTKIAAHVLCCEPTYFVGTHDVYGPKPDPDDLCPACLGTVGEKLRQQAVRAELRAQGKPVGWFYMANQGVWWRTRGGTWIKIEDMTADHAGNTAAYLHRKADRMHFNYAMQSALIAVPVFGGMTYDDLEREQRMLEGMDPTTWLEGTTLYKALLERAGEL